MIVLPGEPKSTQSIYRYACRGNHPALYMSAEGKAIKQAYQWQARAQWKRKLLTSPLQVGFTLYFGTKRRADADNFSKLVLDALTDIVYHDDSQIQELNIRKAFDKKNPRIEVEVNVLP